MEITHQTVRAHYAELLKLGQEWKLVRVEISHEEQRLSAWVEWKQGRKGRCPECGRRCRGYDQMEERAWRHLDTCGYTTELRARVPRVECPEHGIKTVRPSWAEPGSRYTLAFEAHAVAVLLAARNITQAVKLLRMDWDAAQRIRRRAVERGLARRELETVRYLGIDEKSFGQGQSYGTVVSDLEGKRVLEVVPDRTEKAAGSALTALGEGALQSVQAVAMDMWGPYQSAVQATLPQAAIVHDKFHIAGYLNKAVDQVRRSEHRALLGEGDETLQGSKYLWLMNPVDFSSGQRDQFARLTNLNLKVGRAWAYKELFQEFWEQSTVEEGRTFFQRWFGRVARSQLPPLKAAAATLQRHLENILTYFEHAITNATAEGINSFIQEIKANARGFRSFASYRIAILFYRGKLDLSPDFTHTTA